MAGACRPTAARSIRPPCKQRAQVARQRSCGRSPADRDSRPIVIGPRARHEAQQRRIARSSGRSARGAGCRSGSRAAPRRAMRKQVHSAGDRRSGAWPDMAARLRPCACAGKGSMCICTQIADGDDDERAEAGFGVVPLEQARTMDGLTCSRAWWRAACRRRRSAKVLGFWMTEGRARPRRCFAYDRRSTTTTIRWAACMAASPPRCSIR